MCGKPSTVSLRSLKSPLPASRNGCAVGRLRLGLIATLLFVMILALHGCSSSAGITSTPPALMITKPRLTSLTVTPDGGLCMNKTDAAELLIYVERLETAAGVPR